MPLIRSFDPNDPRVTPKAFEPVTTVQGGWKTLRESYLANIADNYNFSHRSPHADALWQNKKAHIQAVKQDLIDQNRMGNLQYFTPLSIQSYPKLITKTLMDGNPRQVESFAKVLNAATPWLQAKDSLLGEPGALTYAKNYLHATGQQEGLKFLRLMQNHLSPDQTQVIMQVLRDPAGYVRLLSFNSAAAFEYAKQYEKEHAGDPQYIDPTTGRLIMVQGQAAAGGVTPISSEQGTQAASAQWSAAFQAGLDEYNRQHSTNGITPAEWNSAINAFAHETGVQIDPNARDIRLPNTNESINMKVAIGQLFALGSQGAFGTKIGLGLTPTERVGYDPGTELVQPLLDAATVGGEIWLTLDPRVIAINKFLQAYGWAAEKVAGGLAFAEGKLRGLSGEEYSQFKEMRQASIVPIVNPVVAVNRGTTKLSEIAVSGARLGEEGTKRYESNVQLVNGLLQMALLHLAGGAARARQSSTTLLPDFAERQLGISGGLREYVSGNLASRLPGVLGDAATGPLFHPLKDLTYGVKRLVYNLSTKPIEESVRTNKGFTRLYDIVDEVKGNTEIPKAQKFGFLRKHYIGMGMGLPSELLSRLMDPAVKTREQMAEVTLDYMRAPDLKYLDDITKRISVIQDNLRDPATTENVPQRMVDSWKMELTRLSHEQASILDQQNSPPMFKFPKESNLMAVVTKTPVGVAQKFLSALYKPLSNTRALSQWVDSMPTYPTLYNPALADRPLGWAEHNAEVVQNYMTKTGVPQDIISVFQKDMFNLKNGTMQDFYDYMVRFYETVDRWLPSDTPKELRDTITRFKGTDNPLESRTAFFSTETTTRSNGLIETVGDPVVPKLTKNADGTTSFKAQPSKPTDFARDIKLTSVDTLNEAVSWYQRMMRSNKGFKVTFGTIGKLMSLSTAIFKPMALAFRMPSVMTRVQLEQALRGMADSGFRGLMTTGGGIPIAGPVSIQMARVLGVEWRDLMDPRTRIFKDAKEMALGQIVGELGPITERVMPYTRNTANYQQGLVHPPTYVWQSLADALISLRTDWVTRTLVQQGPERLYARWAKEPGAKPLSSDQMRDMDMMLEVLRDSADSGAIPELGPSPTNAELVRWYFDRAHKAVLDMSGSHPELVHGLRTGRLGGELAIGEGAVHPTTGEPLGEYYGRLQDKLNQARSSLEEMAQNKHLTAAQEGQVRAWREIVQNTLDEINYLEQRVPEVKRGGHVPFESKGALATRLEELWNRQEYQLPPTIEVWGHRTTFEDSMGIRENMSVWRRVSQDAHAASRTLGGLAYKPFELLQWADRYGTRSSIYYQSARRYYDTLISRGYKPENAIAIAQEMGAEYTRKLLYDLSERTSLQRTLKNTFWFLPAQMEMMGIWFDRLPRAYGAGLPQGLGQALGLGLGIAQVGAFMDVLRGAGLVVKDNQGNDAIPLPWLQNFLTREGYDLSGMDLLMPLKGMNMVTDNPWPGMATGPSWVIGALARRRILYMDKVANFLMKYNLIFSEDTLAVPNSLNLFWQTLTGHRMPLEFLSPDYSKYRYDKGMDQAIQFEYDEMSRAGDLPPLPEDYYVDGKLDQAAYEKARSDWVGRLMSGAQNRFRAISLVNALGSLGAPGPIYATSDERNSWMAFWSKIMGDGQVSDAEKAQIDSYLNQHPNAMAYATFYSRYTGKEGPAIQATNPEGDNATGWSDYLQNYFDKQKEVLSAEDYALLLMATTSYAHYVGQRNTLLKDISPNLDPAVLVSHGFERSQANVGLGTSWGEWQFSNPEAAAVLKKNRLNWAKEFGVPVSSYQAERLGTTLTTLKDIAGYLSDGGTKPLPDFKVVIGELSKMYSEEGVFGKPNTPTEKALAWYFEKVYIPWANKVQPLYEQAHLLSEAGKDASDIYDQIRAINDSYGSAQLTYHSDNKWNGKVMPVPEAVTFGNKSPRQQDYWKINIATKPITWLTNYQMAQTDVPEFQGRDLLITQMNQFEDYYHQILQQRNVAPGSAYADTLEQWRYQTEYQMAAKYGDPGVKLFQLNEAQPIDRIVASGIASAQNPDVQWAMQTADQIGQRLRSAGLSPKGQSADAIYYKDWFYRELVQRGANDPNSPLGAFMEQASYAIPDKGDEQRLAVPLWEALFFGNFNTDTIPEQLINLG